MPKELEAAAEARFSVKSLGASRWAEVRQVFTYKDKPLVAPGIWNLEANLTYGNYNVEEQVHRRLVQLFASI